MKLMSFWSKFFIALAITILATTGAVVGVFAGQKEQIDMGGSIKYTVPYFTVTFLNYDDTVFETQQVAYGQDATKPATDPTRPDHTFNGWTDYTNITKDRRVTANWIKNEAYLTTESKWQAIVNASAVGSQANIEQIEFVSSVPSGATLIGSVGVTDETAATVWTENCGVFDVKAYYTALSSGKYKISFYSPYTIYAPKSSSFLFSNSTDYSNCLTSLTTLTFGNFNTSKVTSMSNMFFKCSKLTSLDLSKFETSSVTSMSNMFYECSSLTSLNVSSFNTSNVTNMRWMFNSCSSLISLNVSNFDTSNVADMSYMFSSCSSLTSLNVSNFNTSKVTNMQSMFYNCSSLTSLNVSNFNTSKVTTMNGMFDGCSKLTSLNLSSFDMSAVTNTSNMLDWCVSLTEIQTPKAIGSKAVALPTKTNKSWFDKANQDVAYSQIDSSCLSKTLILKENNAYLLKGSLWQAALTSANSNFTQANIKTISFTKTAPTGTGYTQVSVGATTSAGTTAFVSGTAGVSDITAYVKANSSDSTKYDIIFYSPVTIYAPTDSSYLFSNSTTANRLTNLTSISFGNFNTSKVTRMFYTFSECSSLTSLDLSNFDTSLVTTMTGTFRGCSKLTSLNLSNFNTSKVTSMHQMFYVCNALTSINISSFNTSKVTEMGNMFGRCYKLNSLDLSSFDMSAVTNTSNMLSDCSSLTRISTPRTMGSATIALPDNGKWINNANNNGPYSQITGAGMNSITLVIARNLILNYEEQVNCETRSAVLSGVTVTNNFDGSFTLNGTQTANIALASVKVKLNKGDHWGCYYTYISGSYTRTSGSLVAVDLKKENQDSLTTRTYISYGDPGTTSRWIGDITVDQVMADETGTVYFWIWYNPGTSAGATEGGFTFNNLRIKLTFFKYYEAQTSSTLYCCKDAGLPKTVLVPTMEGKDFDGYYGIVDGAGIKYYDKDGKLLVTNFPDQANIRLYPKWTTKKHTTTINPNGGKYNNSTSNTTKTLEENQACDILTSQKDGYYNSSYSDTASRTYEAIYAKNAGVSFNGTASSFGVIPRTYMYTDKILISFEAYSSNWSNLNSQVMLSCTQNGGWSFGHSSGNVSFIVYDSGRNGYMPATSNVAWSSLSAGWHEFTGSFDGQYARLYIDGQLCGMSYLFKGPIKYHASNSIIVGGEAGSAASPDDSYFDGKIRNVIIANDYCDANTISTTAPGNNTGTPYITIGSTSDRTVTAQWTQDVVVDLDDCVTKPYTNLRLSSNTNGAWTTNKTSDGNYEYVLTFNSYKNASMSAGPHIQGLYSYMTHGQRYRITITAKSSKTFSVPMRFEAAAPDASKTINLTTSYQTFYLDFTYDSTAQYHSFTFYSKNYTAGQTITFKDIRISKLLAPSSTYGTLPTLTKTGYTFDGWWTAASNGTKVAENTTLTSNSRHTLYPRWIINESYLLKDWKTALTRKNSNFTPGNIKTISFTNTAPTGSGYTQVSVGATTSAGTTAYASGTAGVSDIIAYVKANSSDSTKYDVIFYSPVTIYAPVDSSELFKDLNITSITINNFNTINVTNMFAMFDNCTELTSLNLSQFNTSNVTNMSWMFQYCVSLETLTFNSSTFSTNKVTSMAGMFAQCLSLSQDSINLVKNFNTSSLTDLSWMFYGVGTLNTIDTLDLSNFNTSKVTNFSNMFKQCKLTTLNISSFDMSQGTNTNYMLSECSTLKTINTPKTMGSVTVLLPTQTGYSWVDQANTNNAYTQITSACLSKTLVLCENNSYLRTDWQTALIEKNSSYSQANIKTIQFTSTKPTGSGYTQVSVGATAADGTTALINEAPSAVDIIAYVKANSSDSTKYDVIFYSPVTIYAPINSSYLFSNNTSSANRLTNLTSISFGNFNTSNVTSMSHMFSSCSSLTSLNVSSFNTSNVTNMTTMFYNCQALTSLNVSNFNTSNVTNMSSMFAWCKSLTSLNVSNFNTSKVTYMSYMFYACSSLTSLNVSNFNTSNVTDMSRMFASCSALTSLNLSNFNTSNVTDMLEMFYACSSLTSLNLSNFNTSNVTDMSRMIDGCSSLTSLDLSNFNTSKVTNMSQMFSTCHALTTLDLSSFNTSKVTDMYAMFRGCSKLTSLNLSNFNTSKVIDMSYMFDNCSKLTSLNLSSFDMSKVTSTSNMLSGCSALTEIKTPKAIGSKAVSLPSSDWYNKQTDAGPYSSITSSMVSNGSITLRKGKPTTVTKTVTGTSTSGGGSSNFTAETTYNGITFKLVFGAAYGYWNGSIYIGTESKNYNGGGTIPTNWGPETFTSTTGYTVKVTKTGTSVTFVITH